MLIENRTAQTQAQALLLTPQLRQALSILQASIFELRGAIDHELAENPALEETEEDGAEAAALEEEGEPEPGSIEPWDGHPMGDEIADATHGDVPAAAETLAQHLHRQLPMVPLTPRKEALVRTIIECLNENGYLDAEMSDLATLTGAPEGELEDAMATVQTLDPPGVGARSLGECLALQLRELGREHTLEARILRDHSAELAAGDIRSIALHEGIPVPQVLRALNRLKDLNPFPGAQFSLPPPLLAIPDVFVRKLDDRYVVLTNEAGLPKVRVSDYYRDLAHSESPARGYLRERVRSASWMVRCLLQRQHTIRRVAEAIVECQRDFLEEGVEMLHPLQLKDVAERVHLHESTVSRAIRDKFMDTPRGVFPFKFFFASRVNEQSGEVPVVLVKELIQTLVRREPPDRPLSDHELVRALGHSKIVLARRTVAKYRQALGIPSAPERGHLYALKRQRDSMAGARA